MKKRKERSTCFTRTRREPQNRDCTKARQSFSQRGARKAINDVVCDVRQLVGFEWNARHRLAVIEARERGRGCSEDGGCGFVSLVHCSMAVARGKPWIACSQTSDELLSGCVRLG